MFRPFAAALPLSILACAAAAQDAPGLAGLAREAATARAEVAAAAGLLHDEVAALIPSAPGWTCDARQPPRHGAAGAAAAIPQAHYTCRHAEQSLDLVVMLDPSVAATICRAIDGTTRGIAAGRVKPDLFRIHEGGAWRIERAAVDLRGCAAGAVALSAQGDRSAEAIARGPGAIDAFAEALLGSDPAALLAAAEASGHAAALERLLELLDRQSAQVAAMIPSPPGANREVTLPSQKDLPADMRLPVPMILGESPGASVRLDIGACRVLVMLSAAPTALHEATTTRGHWGRPGGEDGAVSHAYIRRNTDRYAGRERVDGTGIEVLLDDGVILRVLIPGAKPCESAPGIVRTLFDQIVAQDFSGFRTP